MIEIEFIVHDLCMLCSSWGFSLIKYFVYLSKKKRKKKKRLSLLCMIEFRTCRTRSSHVRHISGSWHVHTEKFMAFLLTLNHLKLMIGFAIVHIYCLCF